MASALATLGAGGVSGLICSLPLTHTYTPGSPGSGLEPVCTNATNLVAEAWGPGAPGGLRASSSTNGGGGGGGGYASSSASGPFAAGTISYALGTAGVSTTNSCIDGPTGTATTIGGAGQIVALMTANSGQGGFSSTSIGGNGGTATGGTTTNTTGGNGATGTGSAGAGGAGANGGAGGAASSGASGGNGTAPGGGGGGAANGASCNTGQKAGDGAAAQVKFTWS